MPRVLNYQGSEYASSSEYARVSECKRSLIMLWVLNMP